MLLLTVNSANTLYCTLQEKRFSAATATVYYLAELQCEATRVKQYFICTTITSNDRYDKLTILQNDAAGNPLRELGLYSYKIYEQTSSSNTDPENASVQGVVETGQGRVTGTSQVTYVEQPETPTTNFIYMP